MSILCQLTNFYVDRTLIIQYEMPGDFIIIYKVTTIYIVIYIVIWSTYGYNAFYITIIICYAL
jgi:uncharacterized membrane protein YqjE